MKKSKIAGIASLAVGGAACAAGAALVLKSKRGGGLKRSVELGAGKGVNALLKGLDALLPDPGTPEEGDYRSENFYKGNEEFRSTAKHGARWKLGYARRSLVPGDYKRHDYYIAGYLAYPPNVMSEVLDDQAVRVICVDDGSGRGIAVFAVIDCVGVSGTDVRRIRAALSDFAREKGIVSLNISATHCHSAIDTQGLWGDLPHMLRSNRRAVKEGRPDRIISGRDPQFMGALVEKTASAVTEAVGDMRRGKLFYTRTSELKYSRDKRPPYVADSDIVRLRFEPDDGSRGTMAVFMAAHPTALGAKNTRLSADYIYYMEEEINRAGKNFIFFQGTQLAIAPDRDFVKEDEPGEGFQKYGRGIGRFLLALPEENEERLVPILNIRHREIKIPADNRVLAAVYKAGFVNNAAVRDSDSESGYSFISEIGYAELGRRLALALVPGELAPEILLGGAYGEEESCNHSAWQYPPLKSLAHGLDMSVIGLCNDAVGYIIPDNDYGSLVAENHYEEAVSAGGRAASSLMRGFAALTDECDERRSPAHTAKRA